MTSMTTSMAKYVSNEFSMLGSPIPSPPCVRSSHTVATTRVPSAAPSMAMAKYGPLSRKTGNPIINETTKETNTPTKRVGIQCQP